MALLSVALASRWLRRRSLFYTGKTDIIVRLYTGFPIKDARLLKYEKLIFSIILPSFSSLSRSEIYFSYEKRASFLGDPVPLFDYISVHFLIRRLIEHIQNSFENRYFRALCCFLLQGVPFFYFSHNSYEADWARIFIHPLLFISQSTPPFPLPSKSMIMNNFLMKFV